MVRLSGAKQVEKDTPARIVEQVSRNRPAIPRTRRTLARKMNFCRCLWLANSFWSLTRSVTEQLVAINCSGPRPLPSVLYKIDRRRQQLGHVLKYGPGITSMKPVYPRDEMQCEHTLSITQFQRRNHPAKHQVPPTAVPQAAMVPMVPVIALSYFRGVAGKVETKLPFRRRAFAIHSEPGDRHRRFWTLCRS